DRHQEQTALLHGLTPCPSVRPPPRATACPRLPGKDTVRPVRRIARVSSQFQCPGVPQPAGFLQELRNSSQAKGLCPEPEMALCCEGGRVYRKELQGVNSVCRKRHGAW